MVYPVSWDPDGETLGQGEPLPSPYRQCPIQALDCQELNCSHPGDVRGIAVGPSHRGPLGGPRLTQPSVRSGETTATQRGPNQAAGSSSLVLGRREWAKRVGERSGKAFGRKAVLPMLPKEHRMPGDDRKARPRKSTARLLPRPNCRLLRKQGVVSLLSVENLRGCPVFLRCLEPSLKLQNAS